MGRVDFPNRQEDCELRAFADAAFDSHASLMLFDDLFAGGQAQSGAAFARGIGSAFGGEVRFEDPVQDLGWHAAAIVADRQPDAIGATGQEQFDHDGAAFVHGLAGIGQQVE